MDEALAALDALWGVVGQWQVAYTGWRETRFRDIKVRTTHMRTGRGHPAPACWAQVRQQCGTQF